MPQRIIILGGGFLGQLLHTIMPSARVFDWRPNAPLVPARQLGPQYLWEKLPHLPCREFDVVTTVDGGPATDELVLAYKQKVGKTQDASDWLTQFRYMMKGYDPIMPPDRVEYGRKVQEISGLHQHLEMADGQLAPYDLLISTIPLNHMLLLTRIRHTPLKWQPIYVRTSEYSLTTRHPMYVDYISDPNNPVYRSTIREGKLYDEALVDLRNSVKIMPGKIYSDPKTLEYLLQLNASNIFCFGRFARWEPDELAHQTFQSAQVFVKEMGVE